MRKEFNIPDKCEYCGKVNFKIHGGLYRVPHQRYTLEVRCMVCGRIAFKESDKQ